MSRPGIRAVGWLVLLTFTLSAGCARRSEDGLPRPLLKTEAASPQAAHAADSSPFQWNQVPADKHGVRRLALLVGVTRYPHLPQRYQLAGPAQDVMLMQRLLCEKFGFAPAGILTLLENEPTRQATAHNILGALDALAQQARRGDRVVIYLSGHGSRIPRLVGPADTNPEALTGIFLPRDVGAWDPAAVRVDNTIEDRTLGIKCQAMLDRGAFVWLIVDACHAGGMAREQGRGLDGTPRDVPAEALKVPQPLLIKAARTEQARGTTSRGPGEPNECDAGFRLATDSPRLAAVYACRSVERTFETRFPVEQPREGPYGICTYALCRVLNQAARPLTCAELVRRMNLQYEAWGRMGRPVVLAEGKGAQHFLLEESIRQSSIRLARGPGSHLTINAGRLHGLEKGSILAVYPPPGTANDDQLLGHVGVVQAAVASATVQPVAFAGRAAPLPSQLQPDSVCRPVYYDLGIEPIPIDLIQAPGVAQAGSRMRADWPTTAQKLSERLHRLAVQTRLFRLSEKGSPVAWHVQLTPGTVGEPTVQLQSTRSPMYFRPPHDCHDWYVWLSQSLRQIARGEHLLRVVAQSTAGATTAAPQIGLRLKVYRHQQDTQPWRTYDSTGRGITLYEGDWVMFEMTNYSDRSLDMSLLFLASDCGLKQWFPTEGQVGDNRVGPGRLRRTRKLHVNASTQGTERMILVAVPSRGEMPIDFGFLEEPGIAGAQTRGNDALLDSPLGKLLLLSQYPSAGTGSRGLDQADFETFAFQSLPWRTAKGPRPPKHP